MKQLIPILLFAIILASCTQPEEVPQDLAGKQQLLKEKKAELKSLEKTIAQLEMEIEKLDTTKREKSRRLVTTKSIDRSDFERFVEIQASVQAGDVVYASSETGGRIIRLNVKEGQQIRKGQLIAKTDMESINKQIDELNTSLGLAVEVYERQKRLWDQNIGSEIQYLQAKNNKERIEKSLETLKHQLTKANVYAPISGVIDKVMVESGEVAAPGSPIVEILNSRNVKVVADVPENYLKAIRKGEQVKIKFPALDKEMQARVSLIGSSINPANRTFEVEVQVPNRDGTLKPNLLSVMLINDLTEKDIVKVPLELVQQEVSGKDYVYIKGEGTEGPIAKKVYVTTGESYQGEIIIKEGLKGGEELIVDGARGLAENELIQVQQAAG